LRLVGQRLAWGLSHVVHLYHPDVLIIGGGLSLLGRPLKESVKEQLPDFVMKAFLPPPPVKLAALGEDVVPLGALALTRMNSEPSIIKRIIMQSYFHQYLEKQKAALDSVPLPAVEQIVEKFQEALMADRQLFMMGNGGNASNASHFVTDLGKGASDKTVKRFR